MRSKKIIKCPKRSIEMMMASFGCGKVAVYNALAYRSDSEMAKTIRKQAVSLYGGVETSVIVF